MSKLDEIDMMDLNNDDEPTKNQMRRKTMNKEEKVHYICDRIKEIIPDLEEWQVLLLAICLEMKRFTKEDPDISKIDEDIEEFKRLHDSYNTKEILH